MRTSQVKRYLKSNNGAVYTGNGVVFADSFVVKGAYFKLFIGKKFVASFPLMSIDRIFTRSNSAVQVFLKPN